MIHIWAIFWVSQQFSLNGLKIKRFGGAFSVFVLEFARRSSRTIYGQIILRGVLLIPHLSCSKTGDGT